MERKSNENCIDYLKKIISSLGLELVENAQIKGKSGVNHLFKLVIRGNNDVMAIHILKHLTTFDVCRIYIYKIDTGISQLILYSNSNNDALKTASQLDVSVIDKNDLEKLREVILKHIELIRA